MFLKMYSEKKQSKLPPNFIIKGNRYSLQNSIWKIHDMSLNFKMAKLLNSIKSGINEQSMPNLTILNRSVKLFTQSGLFSDESVMPVNEEQSFFKNKGNLYSMNLLTGDLKEEQCVQKDSSLPQNRSSYGIVEYDGQICIFGGVKTSLEEQKLTQIFYNDLHKYCPYTKVWTQIGSYIQNEDPAPRIPQIFTVLSGNFFIFGGYNNETVFNDAYYFFQNKWIELQIKTKQSAIFLSNLKGISFCTHNEKLYIFGGCNYQEQYFSNQMFNAKINLKEKSLSFIRVDFQEDKIQKKNHRPPCERSNHSMISIDKNYIAVVGGKGLVCQKKYQKLQFHERIRQLTDIIFYNVSSNIWQRVHPLNGPLPKFKNNLIKGTHNIALHYNNSIYILGKQNEDSDSKILLIEIEFAEYEVIRPEMCGNCRLRIKKQKDQPLDKKSPFISNGLIYNLAFQINFPFQAFGLISDFARDLQASQLSIKCCQQTGKYSYFKIKFDGKGISHEKFKALCSHIFLDNQYEVNGPNFMEKLKLGCFRLGKTFLFLNTCLETGFRRAFFFSADSLIIHDFESLYNYMAYEQSIRENYISTKDGIYNKKYIINYLKAYTDNPQKLINNKADQSLILIFQTNKLCNSEKQNHPELIQRIQTLEEDKIRFIDIIPHKDVKKAQFLQKIVDNITESLQISLKRYLSLLYHESSKCFKNIIIESNQITQDNKFSYSKNLENVIAEGKAIQIQQGKVDLGEDLVFNSLLCKVVQPFKDNEGILIYYQDRLINRMDVNLGDIFWSKFYKNKYKENQKFITFDFIGIVNIESGLQLNICMNKFNHDKNYAKFSSFFTETIEKSINPPKQKILSSDMNEEKEQLKKGKPMNAFQQFKYNHELLLPNIMQNMISNPPNLLKKKEEKNNIEVIDLIDDQSNNQNENNYDNEQGTKRFKKDLHDE